VPPKSFTHKPLNPQTLINKQFSGTPALIHIGWIAGEPISRERVRPFQPPIHKKEKTTCQ
jgi:hypothetical protein